METPFNILYGDSGSSAGELAQKIFAEMKFLHEISQKISETMPLSRLLAEIMESSKLVVQAEASSLLLYEAREKRLYFQTVTGDKADVVRHFSLKLGEGLAGWVAQHRQPLLIEDCYQDSRFDPKFDHHTRFRTRSMICVPLIRKRKLIGVMQVLNKKEGGTFLPRDLIILETLAAQCAIAIENARLVEVQIAAEAVQRELATAREIQQRLLPASLPVYQELDVAARLVPAEDVGGDYYTLMRIDERYSLFIVADVTGKGIPAALLVSTLHSALLTYLDMSSGELHLRKMVPVLNRVLTDCTGGARFVTAWFGLYDHAGRRLTSINAGHNPPFLYVSRETRLQKLDNGGLFLGILERPYEDEQVELHSGDVIIFYSDGITEAENSRRQLYSEARLASLILENHHLSAQQQLDAITHDVKLHAGRARQSDDITLGVIKVN
jgi:sigma-B regulation protein RsbU (phosphoserine phosphatase)